MRTPIATLVLAVFLIHPFHPDGTIQLSIDGGRLSLGAREATPAQILSEWARIGATQILNADRLSSIPLNLQLTNISEEDALEVLLRSAGGFVARRRSDKSSGS